MNNTATVALQVTCNRCHGKPNYQTTQIEITLPEGYTFDKTVGYHCFLAICPVCSAAIEARRIPGGPHV